MPRRRLRLLVGFALAFLLLDTVLLLIAGVMTRRALPLGLGAMTLLLAGVVLLLQRRFSSRWDEITDRRQELRSEVASWAGSSRPTDSPRRDP